MIHPNLYTVKHHSQVEMTDTKTKTHRTSRSRSHGRDPTHKVSMVAGDMIEIEQEVNFQLKRTLGTRHIAMIGIGSSIGMGLWLGSGKGLANGGPGSLFIGFVIASSIVWAVSQSIGEMAVMYPLPSAFVQWTNQFVDPAVGFALGWCYWFNYWIAVANELQGVVTVLQFWNQSVPKAAWISIFWLVIVLINIGGVKLFAEVEVVMSAIKFGWIFVVIITSIIISAGGAPNHEAVGFRFWNEGAFLNGFKGFLTVMPICIFALSGSESTALVASELSNPRKAVPGAVRSIAIRLAMFYLAGSLMITITVSPSDPSLFGAAAHATDASPFVVAFRNAGLTPLAHMMNAIIFLSVLSSGSINAYAGSRTLVGLSEINMAPSWMQKADSWGRPWYSLVPTLLIGGGLAYLNVSHSGAEVFGWLSSLTSLFTLFGWSMICLSHIRMRHAWKYQGRPLEHLPWRSKTSPWSAYWGLSWCVVLIILQFYLSVWPFHGESSAKSFFSTYISIPVGIVIYIGAKCYYGGRRWLDSKSIDLDAGRRFYPDEMGDTEAGNKSVMRNLRTWCYY